MSTEERWKLVGTMLTQDLHDFKCAGHIIPSRVETFEKRLAEWCELSKQYTKQWQSENGYGQ